MSKEIKNFISRLKKQDVLFFFAKALESTTIRYFTIHRDNFYRCFKSLTPEEKKLVLVDVYDYEKLFEEKLNELQNDIQLLPNI